MVPNPGCLHYVPPCIFHLIYCISPSGSLCLYLSVLWVGETDLKWKGVWAVPRQKSPLPPRRCMISYRLMAMLSLPSMLGHPIWEWLGTETGCYGDCREIGQWKNHPSLGRLQSLRLGNPCLCDSALMTNNASELKSNRQAICPASLYFSTTSLWIKTLHWLR